MTTEPAWTPLIGSPQITATGGHTISGPQPANILGLLGGPMHIPAGCPVRFRAVGDPAVAWWCPDGHDPGDEDEG